MSQNKTLDDDSLKKDLQNDLIPQPYYFSSGDDAETNLNEQDASSLLQSSRDVFVQFASFQFGAARYRMRGYSPENQTVMMNGINLANFENGVSSWSSWGGLNDVTRYTESRFGIVSNRFSFSGPGGYINIDSKASSFKKGTRLSYGNANRIFKHRLMVTHSSGLLKNGWALTISASARWGDELQIQGTYLQSKSFYISVDKRITKKHLFSLTSFVAPVEKGLSSSATKEVYEISDSHFYNSVWGYQNGVVRNSSVSKSTKPTLIASHYYTPSQNKRLQTSLFYSFGKSSRSGLNFNNAANPRPDYYKYLPSYAYLNHDTLLGDQVLQNWQQDVNVRQVNWDKLVAANQVNLYTLPNEVGQTNTSETRARYILENSVEQLNTGGFNLIYNERRDNVYISAGLNGTFQKTNKFKTIEDLLGASFWIDVDQFASNLGVDPSIEQNDLDHPNKKIVQGDKFGYNYLLNVNKAEAWAQAEYSAKKLDFYGGFSFSKTAIWRNGLVANGKFPTSSKGESQKLNFTNYALKAGLMYKLNGRNFISSNLEILTRSPEAANIFISPKVRNDVVDNLQNEEVVSADVTYMAKYPNLKLRFSLYSTQLNHQTWLRTYWNDEYNNTVNLIMTGVNQKHQGIELGLNKTIFTSHSIQLAFAFSQSFYSNQPKLQAWQDNNNVSLYSNRRVYLNNYRLGNSPQVVSGLGYKYTGKKFWFVGMNINYIDQIYIEPNPDRRTEEAASKFQTNEKELAAMITAQEKLPAYYYINLNSGKSFRIAKKYNLNFNLSINNLLNNTNIQTSGYEQLRWSQEQVEKFPNKYSYMNGISYMLLLNFSF